MKNRTTTLTKEEVEQWYKDHPSKPNKPDNSSIQFPTIRKVTASTIGGGGWEKSKKQQLRESRINKLRQLEGKKPNVTLEKDIWVEGLVSVKPMSGPVNKLTYIDFKYGCEK